MKYLIIMLLGHLVGDYLLQTSKMAREKNKRGLRGWLYALYHGFVYSIGVTVPLIIFGAFEVLSVESLVFFLFTWFTHATIDHYSLAKKWSQMMKSDTLPDFNDRSVSEVAMNRTEAEIYKIAFNSFVYIAVDNTLHLVLQSVMLVLLIGR